METKEINNELEIATKEDIEAKTIESTAEPSTETEKAKELPSKFGFDNRRTLRNSRKRTGRCFAANGKAQSQTLLG